MNIEESNENYSKSFKAIDYHRIVHEQFPFDDEFELALSFIHNIVESRQFEGTKLLEIGSGPTVHHIASASKYFTNIVQSDFVHDNLESLKSWLEGDSPLDWSKFLNIVAKVEGCSENLAAGRQILESRIRKSVKKVVHCDLRSESVLPLEELTTSDISPPYDLIIAAFCVECAAVDFEDYCRVLKRINKLLRTGGGFILASVTNAGKYALGGKDYYHLPLKSADILKALEAAGFRIHDFKTQTKGERPFKCDYDFESEIVIAAEKL